MDLKYEITTWTGYYAGKHELSASEMQKYHDAPRQFVMKTPQKTYVRAACFLSDETMKKCELTGDEVVHLFATQQ